jgi:hypothetical protein
VGTPLGSLQSILQDVFQVKLGCISNLGMLQEGCNDRDIVSVSSHGQRATKR